MARGRRTRKASRARRASLGAAALSTIVLPLAPAEADEARGKIRFLHAVAGAPPADLLVSGGDVTVPSSFSEPSAYKVFRPGEVELALLVKGMKEPTVTERVRLGPGRHTVVAVGKGGGVDLLIYNDGKPRAGAARLRAVHAAGEVGKADVVVDGNVVAQKVDLGDATPYLEVPPGSHDVEVTRPGGKGGALLAAKVNAVAGTAATAYVVGTGGAPAEVVVTPDATVGPSAAPATGLGGAVDGGSWLIVIGASLLAGSAGGATYLLRARRRSPAVGLRFSAAAAHSGAATARPIVRNGPAPRPLSENGNAPTHAPQPAATTASVTPAPAPADEATVAAAVPAAPVPGPADPPSAPVPAAPVPAPVAAETVAAASVPAPIPATSNAEVAAGETVTTGAREPETVEAPGEVRPPEPVDATPGEAAAEVEPAAVVEPAAEVEPEIQPEPSAAASAAIDQATPDADPEPPPSPAAPAASPLAASSRHDRLRADSYAQRAAVTTWSAGATRPWTSRREGPSKVTVLVATGAVLVVTGLVVARRSGGRS